MATGISPCRIGSGDDDEPLIPSSLKKSEIRELGSLEWLEKHGVMFKLVLQALKSERDMGNAASFGIRYGLALPVLVHEVVLVRLWKELILPDLQEEIIASDSATILTKPILAHEIHALTSLRAVIIDSSGPDLGSYLEQASLDLADYCLINLSKILTKQEGKDCEDAVTFLNRIFFESLHILKHVILNVEDLGSEVAHLIVAADAPMILTELLLQKPWTRMAWKSDRSSMERLIETDVWLCLCLLFADKATFTYELTEERKKKLLELRPLLDNERTLNDVGPLLRDFRELLDHYLRYPGPQSRSSLLPEVVPLPPIRKALEKEFQSDKNALTRLFRKELIGARRDNYEERINKILNINDRDAVKASFPLDLKCCKACGNMATQRCTRCKVTWYCGRKCQVKDWSRHKREDCDKEEED